MNIMTPINLPVLPGFDVHQIFRDRQPIHLIKADKPQKSKTEKSGLIIQVAEGYWICAVPNATSSFII